ncbi:hypothetical protein [Nonomuraea wenchangensis]|nr:hypothetical protein [Nonomuraea wenchangensis]
MARRQLLGGSGTSRSRPALMTAGPRRVSRRRLGWPSAVKSVLGMAAFCQ